MEALWIGTRRRQHDARSAEHHESEWIQRKPSAVSKWVSWAPGWGHSRCMSNRVSSGQAESGMSSVSSVTTCACLTMNGVGEPCAGSPHARFDRGPLGRPKPRRDGTTCTHGDTTALSPSAAMAKRNQRPVSPRAPSDQGRDECSRLGERPGPGVRPQEEPPDDQDRGGGRRRHQDRQDP